MRLRLAILLVLSLAAPATCAADSATNTTYDRDYSKWKAELEDDLRKNWLTLVGLFWLKDGVNRVGGDQHDEVPLPSEKVPAQLGTIDFHANKATFKANPGAKVTSGAKPVHIIDLQPDVTGNPTVLDAGDIHFFIIQRSRKFGVRVKDMRSKYLADFKGTTFYPSNRSYIVTGTFIPYNQPRKVSVPTRIGQNADMDSPGEVEFTLNGRKLRLQALSEGTPQLFFIFKDQTSGKTTYPPGRFMYSDAPKNGRVILDFNRAYSPPCAWTPYATCPLPPKQNNLNVAIEAGEKFSGQH